MRDRSRGTVRLGALAGLLWALGCSDEGASDGGAGFGGESPGSTGGVPTGGQGSGGSPATGGQGASGSASGGSGASTAGTGGGATQGERALGSPAGNGTGCAGEMDACGICDGDGSVCGCTAGFCKAVVDEHNAIRSAVNLGTYYSQPQAEPPIAMMTWDPLIAAKAQEYADSVEHWDDGHSSGEFRTYTSTHHDGRHGENMAIGGGQYAQPSSFVGQSWGASEAQGCKLSSCGGHYTQIVWRQSIAVGCGTKENVPFVVNGKTYQGTLIVCQYGAAGNSGGDPY